MNSRPERHDKIFAIRGASSIDNAAGYFSELSKFLPLIPYETIDQITARLARAYEENRTLFVFGNGGSAALASHSACDLGKGTVMPGKRRFKVVSLTDNVPLMTAWANDASYEDVFAEQLLNLVRNEDVVMAISGSGNSPNVLNGLKAAREAGAYTMGLTGYQGGKMEVLCDLCLVIPCDNMQFIEDIHTCVTHSIFTGLRALIQVSQLSVPPVQISAHRREPSMIVSRSVAEA